MAGCRQFLSCLAEPRSDEERPPAESGGDLLGTGSELDALFILVLPEGTVNGGRLSVRMPQLSQ